ncbi:Globoside alpha-1,3-N-acetylgalactosaminyltransferase 1 [Heterocephalus glaber]|uniref:Globoside alpha-1,3-N-acetylgalactosaminyltransferase 1 n=1 Tax=Heterocephalus glaber TaxID=10181 RepID=G5ANW5_HETGA|nr:Globoside alpha-1,3-N-acetylgalactosaminyltransferase 1 [Heterocephalus glaber]
MPCCQRLGLGLGLTLLASTGLWALYNMKLRYKEEKPWQPVAPSQYPQPRLLQHRPTELLTLTPWLAPIISEGAFDPELLRHIYQPYTQFVQHFLELAEGFFMLGYQVHCYVFTHNPAAIPRVPLGPGRLLDIIPTRGHAHWEEVSMRRMETISQHITKRAHRKVDYLFCLDVDMVFQNPWGPETLGDLVAAIHPGYFTVPRQQFPYERRQVSTAFVADNEGDFYYDKANGIMAAWQEESHLNHRLITHKPSKVLSPVYIWDDRKPVPPSLKLIRFSTLVKDTGWLRS